MIILCTLILVMLMKNIKKASRWFILAQTTQNLELVNLKCVTYTQPIWVASDVSKGQTAFADQFKNTIDCFP